MIDHAQELYVPDEEVWYRRILTPSEVAKPPAPHKRLNPKFFEEKFGCATNPEWKKELSGRLLSKGGSIEADADANVERMRADGRKNVAFHGVIASNAAAIRQIPPLCFDVRFTPTEQDAAHADLIATEDLTIDGLISAEKTRGLRNHFRLLEPGTPGFPIAPNPPVAGEI
ncbi:hypothetical protein [Caballeronia sordidicola]|uniref:hypothetical protein n=1 Tax=Caballeronia sordidicola TaxID=196367 RepID=UPI000A3B6F88|nr:hypothetical protein [Caballeronia sordidicola]